MTFINRKDLKRYLRKKSSILFLIIHVYFLIDLDKKLQIIYAEVHTKDELFYNFVENILNKKSYDRPCISCYMVTRDVF